MTSASSSKRRKTEKGIGSCLSDLPIGILEHTAGFLAAPSRALFAVALATDHATDQIAGTADWEILDFGEIEKDLAAKLSDNDLSAVLQHIDAVNNVKRLKLTDCINFTGAGLGPLRGSTIIEQIDLSLTGDGESPMLDPEPPISCELVLPIVDSIIASDRCAIKHLQFPYKWRKGRSTESAFHAFILRYHQMWENRDTISCLYCDADLPENGYNWITTYDDSKYYGAHCCTCYQCTKHYCYACSDNNGIDNIVFCDQCQRDYCKECVKAIDCGRCGESSCEHCSNYKECDKCNDKMCAGCDDETFTVCIYCGVSYCNDCNQNDDGFIISLCAECNEFGCDKCRLRRCQEGSSDCDGCIKTLPQNTLVAQFRRLQEESLLDQVEVDQLKNVNRRLQEEVDQLKSEIRELKLENKVLQDKET